MPTIPKKVVDRYRSAVPKFQKILAAARDRDVNEADTVSIVQDMLAEVYGFDKYAEVTSEYAIRGTYCDLAVKVEGKVQYLIEVKSVGLSLKDTHVRQVVDYGTRQGIQWVVCTNGIDWQLHKLRFERPVTHELVVSFDFLQLNRKSASDQEKLFLLSKRGLSKAAREEYYERVQCLNRHVIASLLLTEPHLSAIRRDIRRLSSGLRVKLGEIETILRADVLKRGAIEGAEAAKADSRVKKHLRKTTKKSGSKSTAGKKKESSDPHGSSELASVNSDTGDEPLSR